MISNVFRQLSKSEKATAIIFTLFNVGDNSSSKLHTLVRTVAGLPRIDFQKNIQKLNRYNLLTTGEYNWRRYSYNHHVSKAYMLPLMLHIAENEKELTQAIMKKASFLKPSELQRILWKFVITGFTQLPSRSTITEVFEDNEVVLYPYVDSEPFEPIMRCLTAEGFCGCMDNYLYGLFREEASVNTSYLRRLLDHWATPDTVARAKYYVCLLDLYDFMAHGTRPDTMLMDNSSHQWIAALTEMYKGGYNKALGHIKLALALCNTKEGKRKLRRSYFAYGILNFFYVLTARLADNEEAQKHVAALLKGNSKEETKMAEELHSIIYNADSDKIITASLRAKEKSNWASERSMVTLMENYIGMKVSTPWPTQWLILRHEMRPYKTLQEEDLAKADAAYGQTGALSRLHRKKEWEYVLEELMRNDEDATAKRKDERIAYFMHTIKSSSATPKLQTILKSGAWSAGKNISRYDFESEANEAMDSADKRIAQASRRAYDYSDVTLEFILPEMTHESRLYVGAYAPYTLVEVTEESPYITLVREDDQFRVVSNVPLIQADKTIIITHRAAASISFLRLPEAQRIYYKRLLQLEAFPLEAEEQLKAFLGIIGGKLEVNSDLIEGGSTLPITSGSPQLIMQMRPQGKDSYAVSLFTRPLEGGRKRCTPGEGDNIIVDQNNDGQRTRVERNVSQEKDNLNHFMGECHIMGLQQGNVEVDTPTLLPIITYAQNNAERMACEWPEGASLRVKRKSQSVWNGFIRKADNGWFEIEGSVEIDQGRVVTMAQLLDLVGQRHGRYIKLNEGEFLELSKSLQNQLEALNAIASHSHGRLQISPFSAALLSNDEIDGELQLDLADELKAIRQRILDASTYKPRVPKTLQATLRPYQLDGYQWMSRLNKWGAGALLADDMGLGKTVQTIAFLLAKAGEGPALVVAPASVAPNWMSELERFAPSLNASMLNFAADRKKLIKEAKKGEVVVTTYGLLLSVKAEITKKKWTTVCLDEAHIVKNRGAKTSAVAMQLQGNYRIMLTGTPVQNHLAELWNLFQFVNPGLLGSYDDFTRRFINPIELQGDKEAQHQLDRLVKPFMLRRTKDKVAKELPEKEEIYQHVTLSADEQAIYELMRQRAEQMLLAEQGRSVSVATLAEITRLRQCSCDARLIEEGRKIIGDKEGTKIQALLELIETIVEGFTMGDDKKVQGGILVFSQFTSYLKYVQEALQKAEIHYLYIDGSTELFRRAQLVKEFQDGACPVFLISLKAGGLGLNLTRANYVIHMDPWWNPAVEAQATDRAHRIGQQQAVTVYHLIAEGTIEEKIQRLHEQKQELVRGVLEGADQSHKLTGEQLLQMVRGK